MQKYIVHVTIDFVLKVEPVIHMCYERKKLKSKIHVIVIWTEMNPLYPTYAIFLKMWGFKDVKYDILMCQSHSTRPHNAKKARNVIILCKIPEN